MSNCDCKEMEPNLFDAELSAGKWACQPERGMSEKLKLETKSRTVITSPVSEGCTKCERCNFTAQPFLTSNSSAVPCVRGS